MRLLSLNPPTILLLTLLIVGTSSNCFSQFSVNTTFDKEDKSDTFSERALEELKTLTTYALIKPDCESYIPLIEKMVKVFWGVGEIKLVTHDQYYDYLEANPTEYHGLIDISALVTTVGSSISTTSASYSTAHYYLRYKLVADIMDPEEYWLKSDLRKFRKEGREPPVIRNEYYFADYELYPGQSIIKDIDEVSRGSVNQYFANRNIDLDDHMKRVILEGKFFNYEPGFIVNYLRLFNDYLLKNKEKNQFDNIKESLGFLKQKTLYIPDYVLEQFNKFKGFRGYKFEEKDLMKDYQYKYEMVSSEELNDLILNAEEDIYFYTFIRGTTDAYHTITNGLTGEVLYSRYDPLTYNISDKDFKKISGEIE